MHRLLVTAAMLAATVATDVTAAGDDFDGHWRDGKAELDGYRLTVTRYARPRTGQAVMIFVTEPFSVSKLVKTDDPSRNPDDTLDVIKLNLVRDFQTGLYDYNTMTSVFCRTADFEPVKITFSSAEWCGHVYEELLPGPDRVRGRLSSYFEGESAPLDLPARPGGVVEDSLFIQLRGLRGQPYLEPGRPRQVDFLPGAMTRRLRHQPLAWTTAEIERLADRERISVPAGDFDTIVYVVRVADGRLGRFHIEAAAPHRVVRWSWGTSLQTFAPPEAGESGELTGSERLAYWQLHDNGDERHLEALGLQPLPSPE